MTEPAGGWSQRPDDAEEIPLVSAFGMTHMPVAPPAPRPRPHIKGLPDPGPEHGPDPGDDRGHWEPVS